MKITLRSLALLFGVLPVVAHAGGDSDVYRKLTRGHPEVADLLNHRPDLLAILEEPMWRDVVLKAPTIPGSSWQIHDFRRPQPPVVRVSGAPCAPSVSPPGDAIVLFDGRSKDGFSGEHLDAWELRHGELVASGRVANHIATRQSFGDVQLHVEFSTPRPAKGTWQYRGNSGVFLMERYEVQILDSYENPTYADGASGALYGQVPPLVNASAPPGVWQCFDLVFLAPRFENDQLFARARVTLFYNGVLVQNNAQFLGRTRFAAIGPYEAHPAEAPIGLQDHGDPGSRVRFRNIWARRLGALSPDPAAP